MKHQQNHDRVHNGSYGRSKSKSKNKSVRNIAALSLVLVTTVTLYYRAFSYSSSLAFSTSAPSSTHDCDIFSGEWVRDYAGPYYTQKTCSAIHDHQNCMKYGRPDTDFMKWRWKPHACEMPAFDAAQFLEFVRGKKMAFVGDSLGRNQMQSLMCLLSSVENPIDKSYTSDFQFKRYKYKSYNFLLAMFWSPYLVKWQEPRHNGPEHMGIYDIYLDEFDNNWTWQAAEFDYIIISAGHWFRRPMVFHEKGSVVGCQYCSRPNVTELDMLYGYRRAFRTAFKAIATISRIKNYKGITYLRTFAPSHFENGTWDQGGNCVRTKPYRSNEIVLEGIELDAYMAQMEEYRAAEREARERGLKLRLINATQATLLRPDGHPSRYGHWPNAKVTLYNDCVHWCLPGPIDTWNSFLFEMLKAEQIRAAEEKLKAEDRKVLVR